VLVDQSQNRGSVQSLQVIERAFLKPTAQVVPLRLLAGRVGAATELHAPGTEQRLERRVGSSRQRRVVQ